MPASSSPLARSHLALGSGLLVDGVVQLEKALPISLWQMKELKPLGEARVGGLRLASG